MPNLDGTGPEGKGPQTGRKMGNCNKNNTNIKSRGMGRGLGRNGRGFRGFNCDNNENN